MADAKKEYADSVAKLQELETSLTNVGAAADRLGAAFNKGAADAVSWLIEIQNSEQESAGFFAELQKLYPMVASQIPEGLRNSTKEVKELSGVLLGSREAIQSVLGWFDDLGKGITDSLVKGLEEGKKGFKNAIKQMEEDLNLEFSKADKFKLKVFAETESAKSQVLKDLGGLSVMIRAGFDQATLSSNVESMISDLQKKVAGASPQIQSEWQKIFDGMRKLAQTPIDSPAFVTTLAQIRAGLEAIGTPATQVDAIMKQLGGSVGAAAAPVGQFAGSLDAAATSATAFAATVQNFGTLGTIAQVVFGNMTIQVTAFGTAISTQIGIGANAASSILANLNNFSNGVFTNMSKQPAIFTAKLKSEFTTGTNAAKNLLIALNNNSNGIFTNMSKQPPIFAKALVSAFQSSTATAKTALDSLKSRADSDFGAMITKAGQVANAVKGIGTAANAVISQVNNLKNALNSLPNINRTIHYSVRVDPLPSGAGSLSLSTSAAGAGGGITTAAANKTKKDFGTIITNGVSRIGSVSLKGNGKGTERVIKDTPINVFLDGKLLTKIINRRLIEENQGMF